MPKEVERLWMNLISYLTTKEYSLMTTGVPIMRMSILPIATVTLEYHKGVTVSN